MEGGPPLPTPPPSPEDDDDVGGEVACSIPLDVAVTTTTDPKLLGLLGPDLSNIKFP